MSALSTALPTHILATTTRVYAQTTMHQLESSPRWLWIRGTHNASICDAKRLIFERALKRWITELARVKLGVDAQPMSCDRVACARARINASGSDNGLLAQSVCLKNRLRYRVGVVSSDRQRRMKPYQKTFKVASATDDTLESIAYEFARRLIRGHSSTPETTERLKSVLWGGNMGLLIPRQPLYTGLGATLELGSRRAINTSKNWELIMSLSALLSSSERSEHALLGGSLGLSYTPTPHIFAPHLTFGVLGGYQWHSYLERSMISLDTHDLLIGETERRYNQEGVALRPWLELGWMWRGGVLEPGLALRYYPIDAFYDERGEAISVTISLAWRKALTASASLDER